MGTFTLFKLIAALHLCLLIVGETTTISSNTDNNINANTDKQLRGLGLVETNENEAGNDGVTLAEAWMFGLANSHNEQQEQRKLVDLPLTVKLNGHGGSFGWSVALSANTLFVSAFSEGAPPFGFFGKGAVFVYTTSANSYSLSQNLSTGIADACFGYSIAVSSSSSTSSSSSLVFLVGAVYESSPGSNDRAGAAYVFKPTSATSALFSQAQRLSPSVVGGDGVVGTANSMFGSAVALSSSGSVIVVGAYWLNTGTTTNQAGGVFVFKLLGSSYTQIQILSSRIANSMFGISVALSSSSGHIAVGCIGEGPSTDPSKYYVAGAVYIFAINGSATYSQIQRIESGAVDGSFGNSVAFSSSSSSMLVVGASTEGSAPGSGDYTGAVYAYTLVGGSFSQTQRLSSGVVGGQFGSSVALSSSALVVGASDEGKNGISHFCCLFDVSTIFYFIRGEAHKQTISHQYTHTHTHAHTHTQNKTAIQRAQPSRQLETLPRAQFTCTIRFPVVVVATAPIR